MQNTLNTYTCIGCGIQHVTSASFYKGIYICPECRNKQVRAIMKCSVCGAEVPVLWNTLKMAKRDKIWRCKSCNDKFRDNSTKMKEFYANMTPEQRAINSENRKKGWNKRREEGTAEHCLESMKKGRAKWHNGLSSDKKYEYWLKLENGRSKWWDSLTKDEQIEHMSHPHEGYRNWFNNLSKEDQNEYLGAIWEGNKKFWDKMTPEKYREWRVGLYTEIKNIKDSNPSISVEESDNATQTEMVFMNELNKNHLSFFLHYPSIQIHPDFINNFQKNEVTGSLLVDPLHMWDFLIRTNERNVFIDIDGSVHKNNPFVKLNDKKRPYQTDGLDAYVIQAYDDTIGPDNTVVNIKTGEQTTVSGLIALLKAMNNDKL